MKKEVDLLHMNIRETFFKYLIPSVGGMMGISLYVLGDTMIVGRALGSQGLAALNISIPIINIFNGLGLLFGIGGATAVSVNRGQNKHKKVNDIFTKSIVLAIIFGIILTIGRIFFLDRFVIFLGASSDTFQMSKDYLGVLMYFSVPFVLNSALTIFVRNDGAPRLAMLAMLSGSIINIILDYVFIFILKWGMWGGALATGLAPILGLIILSTHFISKKNKLKFITPKIEVGTFKRILSNGASSFVIEISAGIVIFAFNQSILDLTGDIGVSAYSIIANLSLIFSAIFIGVGQAIQPIVSFNYGAGKTERVYEAIRFGVYTSLGLGILFYAIGLFWPEFLVSIFTKNGSEIMDITVKGIRLYFLSFIFMGVNIVMTSYIQSKEHARVSLIISLTRGLFLVIIGLIILPRLIGIEGVWLTLPLVELASFIFSMIYFRKFRNAITYSIKEIRI